MNWNTQADLKGATTSFRQTLPRGSASPVHLPAFQKLPIKSLLLYFILLSCEITWQLT